MDPQPTCKDERGILMDNGEQQQRGLAQIRHYTRAVISASSVQLRSFACIEVLEMGAGMR